MRSGILGSALVMMMLASFACGGGGDTEEGTATPDGGGEQSGGVVTTLEDVQSATALIVAQGTFLDPDVGLQTNTAGSGSGFFISPDGIAVTNNHVVTGAAFLQIYVGGEGDPLNARVLGVSECSDLAVIDVDGDGFPYLEWYDGDIVAALEVFVAGYPFTEEYTVTRGIVSKPKADGETNWASVDFVIEHDATVNPGNSGGPLVTGDAQIVGVNYAAAPSDQYFAVGRDEALKIIDRLKDGDVTSIGVNGSAVRSGGKTGIWVASVASGSPADAAGIRAGDLITALEGLELATDGTMSDYCDILRSHTSGDVLSVRVFRTPTGEDLEGQINGRELAVIGGSVAQPPVPPSGPTPAPVPTAENPGGPYTFLSLHNHDESLEVSVPDSWDDTRQGVWTIDGERIGLTLSATPDFETMRDWRAPGVWMAASNILAQRGETPESLLGSRNFADCSGGERHDYNDGRYEGFYKLWTNCGGNGHRMAELAVTLIGGEQIVWVETHVQDPRDEEAQQKVWDTFITADVLTIPPE